MMWLEWLICTFKVKKTIIFPLQNFCAHQVNMLSSSLNLISNYVSNAIIRHQWIKVKMTHRNHKTDVFWQGNCGILSDNSSIWWSLVKSELCIVLHRHTVYTLHIPLTLKQTYFPYLHTPLPKGMHMQKKCTQPCRDIHLSTSRR